jgi:predicted O-methyltransferase YrrM
MSIPKFEGTKYRLCTEWKEKIPIEDKPINYLEIGAFYGANVVSVAESYAKHPWSKIYVIDPWETYEDYHEYEELNWGNVYKSFTENTKHFKDKLDVTRGYSYDELPKFQNDFFDIIYIDGNHDYAYVLADAILSFAKLKVGGVMIFDDYDYAWLGVCEGVSKFMILHNSRVQSLGAHNGQVLIKKVA